MDMNVVQTILVDNVANLILCLKDISTSTKIAVDCEGVKLCRNGTLSILQLYRKGSNKVWLVDITVLQATAFYTKYKDTSLKTILENSNIEKVFYDCRNDVDALYNLFGVMPTGIWDLQLHEVLTRKSRGINQLAFFNSLEKSIGVLQDIPPTWKICKETGKKLFAPEFGGCYSVFEQRPLDPALIEYCASDVVLLFELQQALPLQCVPLIRKESRKRASLSKKPELDNGPTNAKVPYYLRSLKH
jgi:exonuclease 3'-5' domain-containing protein 1